jgi:hypothetical protein
MENADTLPFGIGQTYRLSVVAVADREDAVHGPAADRRAAGDRVSRAADVVKSEERSSIE